MTRVTEVSQKEMARRTGLPKALGYAFPKKQEVLVRKELKGKARKKVLKHEMEHIEKKEEGPFLGSVIGAAASLFGARQQSNAAEDAAEAQERAEREQIAFARESRDMTRADTGPYRQAGYTALDALMSMTGLGRSAGYRDAVSATQPGEQSAPQAPAGPPWTQPPTGDQPAWEGGRGGRPTQYGGYVWEDLGDGVEGWRVDPNRQSQYQEIDQPIAAYAGAHAVGGQQYNVSEIGPEDVFSGGNVRRYGNPRTIGLAQGGYVAPNAPQENPGGDESYSFMTDPGYNFRFDEGQRALEAGAAARGGLLSGGFGKRAIRYGQDYASNEYSNVYNRIANIAGLASIPNQLSANAALQYGQQAGGAASAIGYGNASSYTAQGNAWGDAIRGVGDAAAGINWGGIFNRGGGNQDVMGTAADPWSLDM